VNLEKLAKQLRRDTAANPKKAAALGLMVLVALYFWGPLVAKWVAASGNKRTSKVNTAALILTDDPAEPTQSSRGRAGGKFRWEKVRQLIRQDPQMISAAFDVGWIDPFGAPTAGQSQQFAEALPPSGADDAASAEVDPSELGIVLGGVLIGPRSRVATINGEACHEGEVLAITDKYDKAVTHRVRVVRIRKSGVVLEVGGRTITVALAPTKLAHGDEIERRKPKPGN
jgi:hypothetical protein